MAGSTACGPRRPVPGNADGPPPGRAAPERRRLPGEGL
jgi:hypothetical protein